MRRLRQRSLVGALIALSTFCILAAAAAAGSSWRERFEEKSWVIPVLRMVGTGAGAVDQIVAIVGREQRIVYESGEHDLSFGNPIVSRDGTHVTFAKTYTEEGRLRASVYVAGLDGGVPRRVLDVYAWPTGRHSILSHGLAQLAWSHDNRTLAVLAARDTVGRAETLVRVDVSSGTVTDLLDVARTPTGFFITDQAWAPDHRRLVYASHNEVVILDTVSGHQQALGPGEDATWSADGRFIAVKLDRQQTVGRGKNNEGDYILIDAEPPHRRTLLLENSPGFWASLFTVGSVGFYGPARWSPDDRFVVVSRFGRSWYVGKPFAHEIATGRTRRVPHARSVHSIGGKP